MNYELFCTFAEMKIHVVSFQVPYPANYGGAIDVFYKLKALLERGYEVVLHTYVYGDRHEEPALEQVCSKVHYYPRKTGWCKQFSALPYIVTTRDSQQLLKDLCEDDAPILFEGLHTCFFLNHPLLARRKKIVRMHNVEHKYYWRLAQQSGWNWRTIYYTIESLRLRCFERQLRHADLICAITKADMQAIEQMVPGKKVIHLPVFFDATFPSTTTPTEPFVLYHGNLAVEENQRAVEYIFRHIVPRCPDVRFVIAGRNAQFKHIPNNVQIIDSPSDEQLDQLLRTARIHLMLTFQPTGIKLKLLNTLVRGNGHIIANHDMLYGHSFGRFCTRADKPENIVEAVYNLINTDLPAKELEKRQAYLIKIKKAGISRLSLFQIGISF